MKGTRLMPLMKNWTCRFGEKWVSTSSKIKIYCSLLQASITENVPAITFEVIFGSRGTRIAEKTDTESQKKVLSFIFLKNNELFKFGRKNKNFWWNKRFIRKFWTLSKTLGFFTFQKWEDWVLLKTEEWIEYWNWISLRYFKKRNVGGC